MEQAQTTSICKVSELTEKPGFLSCLTELVGATCSKYILAITRSGELKLCIEVEFRTNEHPFITHAKCIALFPNGIGNWVTNDQCQIIPRVSSLSDLDVYYSNDDLSVMIPCSTEEWDGWLSSYYIDHDFGFLVTNEIDAYEKASRLLGWAETVKNKTCFHVPVYCALFAVYAHCFDKMVHPVFLDLITEP